MKYPPQMMQQELAVERELLFSSPDRLSAAFTFQVQRVHDPRRRRRFDLEGIEVLLQPAHVIETNLSGWHGREVAADGNPAADAHGQQRNSRNQPPRSTQHARRQIKAVRLNRKISRETAGIRAFGGPRFGLRQFSALLRAMFCSGDPAAVARGPFWSGIPTCPGLQI